MIEKIQALKADMDAGRDAHREEIVRKRRSMMALADALWPLIQELRYDNLLRFSHSTPNGPLSGWSTTLGQWFDGNPDTAWKEYCEFPLHPDNELEAVHLVSFPQMSRDLGGPRISVVWPLSLGHPVLLIRTHNSDIKSHPDNINQTFTTAEAAAECLGNYLAAHAVYFPPEFQKDVKTVLQEKKDYHDRKRNEERGRIKSKRQAMRQLALTLWPAISSLRQDETLQFRYRKEDKTSFTLKEYFESRPDCWRDEPVDTDPDLRYEPENLVLIYHLAPDIHNVVLSVEPEGLGATFVLRSHVEDRVDKSQRLDRKYPTASEAVEALADFLAFHALYTPSP